VAHIRPRFRRAFTLVELLVVIGIIGVLVAILLPAISRAKEQANTTACATTLRQIGLNLKLYQEEFKGSFPYARYIAQQTTQTQSVGSGSMDPIDLATIVWWSALRKYMRTGGQGNWDNGAATQAERYMAAFNCPNGLNRDGGCDFGCNPVVMPDMAYEGGPKGQAMASWGAVGKPADQRVLRPATVKQVDSELAIIWDATEIPPTYNTQFTSSWGVDGGRLAFRGQGTANTRFRGSPDANAPDVGDNTFIEPGDNLDKNDATGVLCANIKWRHRKSQAANFLMGDLSVKTMAITKDYEEPQVRTKGEVRRKNIRPKPPQKYRWQ
jgi:prepilin-type N-terminal cleavage/methylation domain-containing protein